MATKKTNTKAPAKQQKRSTPNISARIDRLVDYENSKVKAIASVNIGGAFAIHGLRVIDSQKGLFVQMPQNSFQKDGKTEYSDIFHPVTAEARSELNSKVLEAYEQKLDEVESENEDLDEGEALDEQDEDAPAFGQSMTMPATRRTSLWHGSSSRTSRSNLRTKLPRKMIWKKNPFKG